MVTVGELLRHFARRQRAVLLPMLVVLVLAGALLVATNGLATIAPFVYTLF
jgi:hypothetical protein